jgi:sugar O-acyltransferase (sialic acid O-acetyltransferase NeuD family)
VNRFGLLGASHQADETAEYLLPDLPLFRAVSHDYLDPSIADLIDIETMDAEFLSLPVVVAVGAPGLKRQLVDQWAGREYRSVIADGVILSPTATVGAGSIIAPGAIVNTRVVLGQHVLVNIGASISHDSVLGDYVTVSPGARIAGRVRLGDGAFVGIGATVANGVSVASGIVIGAGAVVISDLVDPGVYVGVPAKWRSAQEGWLRAL